MEGEWRQVTLADVTRDVRYGYTAPATEVPTGTRFLRVTDIASGSIDWSSVPFCEISEADFERYRLQPGDIVIARMGTIGVSALIKVLIRVVHASYLIRYRIKSACADAQFVSYVLRSPQFWDFIWSHGSAGAVQPNINAKVLARFTFPLPPLPEQRAIAHTLGALDDKIELNRRMARTLEEIARAIFKSWFMDFDPVRAKAEGRRPAVPQELEDLFPSRLVDSPIGPVPVGWEVAPLGEYVEVMRGLSYRGADLVKEGEGLPLHNLNSVLEGGGYKYDGIKWYAGEYKDRHVVEPGDVIVANTEQGHDYLLIGYPAIVPRTFGEEGLFSHHLYRLRPLHGSPLTVLFLYQALLSPRLRAEVIGYTHGTTVNMLAVDGLRRARLAVPPAQLVSSFDSLVRPISELVEQLVVESRTLACLRDWLLPKLVSGRVRIPMHHDPVSL